MNATELTPEMSALVNAARALPPELVRKVADFAAFLGKKHTASPTHASDEWSEADMRDASLAALRRFQAEHPDDDWGTDYPQSEGK